MPFDFPSSPVNGQLYSPAGGPVYMYLNGAWMSTAGAAPVVTSSAGPTVAENSAFSWTLTASKSVTWLKVGGADQALFTLTGATLSMAAKNYEAPVDSNADNVYVVQVQAIDGVGNTTVQTISVTVTDVSEGGGTFNITDTIVDTTALVTGTVKNFASRNLGTAASDRIILFALHYSQNHQGRANPIVTLDGTEMMLASTCERASFQSPSCIYAIPWPTGSSGSFAVDFVTSDANANVPRCTAWVIAVGNCAFQPSGFLGASNGTNGNTAAVTLDLDTKVEAGGLLVCIAGASDVGGTPQDQTWVGVTQDDIQFANANRTTIAHYAVGTNETARDISYRFQAGISQGFNGISACALALAPIGTARKFVWDKFDRANSALGSSLVPTGFASSPNWVWDGRTPQININANRLDNANTNGPGTMYSIDLGAADHWAEWMAEIPNASNGPFVFIRGIDYDNFIGVRDANASVEVYRREASNMNSILTTDFNIMKTTLVRIEAQGTALRVYRNGQLMNTFTLAAPFLTPTRVGLIGRSIAITGFLSKFRGGVL